MAYIETKDSLALLEGLQKGKDKNMTIHAACGNVFYIVFDSKKERDAMYTTLITAIDNKEEIINISSLID